MTRFSLKWAAAIALAVVPLGCSDMGKTTRTTKHTTTTPTTQKAEPAANDTNVDVNAGPNDATATGRTASNEGGAADVNVTPDGGVNVNVDGTPIRDRIRERRAAREAATDRR
jgi:hypothetical protein